MNKKQKLLFVISKDFGELYNAALFAKCLLKKYEMLFLLPEKLYLLNHDDFFCITKPYRKASELQLLISCFKPKFCFLFSGYLFTINNLITEKELSNFLRFLNKKKIKLLTSDPWLNIWPGLNTYNYSSLNFNDPRQVRLIDLFLKLQRILKGAICLYPFAIDTVDKGHLGFYPKQIRHNYWKRRQLKDIYLKRFSLFAKKCFWLFVVSSEDSGFLKDNKRFFYERLQDAVCAGVVPVLIAPSQLLEEIKLSCQSMSNIVFLQEASLSEFQSLLAQAEYVFYWNIFSATIPERFMNSKPLFCFELGHMVSYFPPFLECGKKIYYGDLEPPMLNIQHKLTPKKLSDLAGRQRSLYRHFYKKMSCLPAPDKLLENL